MGLFKTEKIGEFSLTFPEYSGNKRLQLQPDIMEFDRKDYDPQFDLIGPRWRPQKAQLHVALSNFHPQEVPDKPVVWEDGHHHWIPH